MNARSIVPEIFAIDTTVPVLRGGWSPSSRLHHFPLQPVCPYTGADDVEAVELSSVATAWGWTVVTAAPPGYEGPVPYGFGVVVLVAERLRVITRLVITDPSELEFGDPMELCADVVGADDSGTIVTWAFRKVAP